MPVSDWVLNAKLARLDAVPRRNARKRAERQQKRLRSFRHGLVLVAGLALMALTVDSSVDQSSEADRFLQAPAARGEAYAAHHNVVDAEEPACTHYMCTEKFKISTSVLVLVTIIVIFSVMMEQFVLEPLKEDVDENLAPIVETLFSELTLLGFVGLFMFVVTKLHLMEPASTAIFGEATALQELFEAVHMVLFLVMCLFLSFATGLIFYGTKAQERWRHANDRAVDEKHKIIQEYAVAIQTGTKGVVVDQAADHMLFLSLRERFIKGQAGSAAVVPEGEAKAEDGAEKKKKKKDPWSDIPHDFELHDYLSIIQGETTGEIIELPVSSWLFLECAMIFFYIIELFVSPFVFSVVFVAAAYALMLLNMFMDQKLTMVILNLTPKLYYNHAKTLVDTSLGPRGGPSGIAVNDAANITSTIGAAMETADLPDPRQPAHQPDYVKQSLRSREEWGWWRGRLFGGLPDQHQQLFWGGRKGASLMLFLIRIQLMWSAIYISVFLVVNMSVDEHYFKGQPVGMAIMFLVVLIPVVVNFLQISRIIAMYVVATSVELMKKPEIIRRVRRRMTTKKAVRCLKLIRMMKKKMPKKGKIGEQAGEHRDAHVIYSDAETYKRKRRELQELFDLFDKDHSKDIEVEEMLELLQMMNMAEDEEMAMDMINQLDADGSGKVEFEEFFDWMANQEADEDEDEDIEEYVGEMFAMIDTDGSGSITAEEFQDCLKNLGTELSMEDIQAMIREVDENGDGDIDQEEFVKMVEKYSHSV